MKVYNHNDASEYLYKNLISEGKMAMMQFSQKSIKGLFDSSERTFIVPVYKRHILCMKKSERHSMRA